MVRSVLILPKSSGDTRDSEMDGCEPHLAPAADVTEVTSRPTFIDEVDEEVTIVARVEPRVAASTTPLEPSPTHPSQHPLAVQNTAHVLHVQNVQNVQNVVH